MSRLPIIASLVLLLLLFPLSVSAQGDLLPQTYEDPGGVITLNYPDGWVVDKYFGVIFLANSQAAMEGDISTVETGELQINLMAGTSVEVGLSESGTALEMGQAMIAEAAGDSTVSSTAGPEALEDFQYDAARISVVQGNVDILAIIIVGDPQHAAMMLAGAPAGEISQYEDTILAIARSIQFVGVEPGSATGGSTGSPADAQGKHPISWQTETVSLSADDFHIVANGQTFTADVAGVDVDSDPGDETYTTLEVEWEEHSVPMRVNMYFEADGTNWQAFEIRIYDGSPGGEWITYENPAFTTPLGQAYQVGTFSRDYYGNVLYFENLQVQAFTSGETGTTTEGPTGDVGAVAVPTTLSGPEDCYNVAASIGDYSSEYSSGYSPANLLDNDPTTGWSSAGEADSEYVVVILQGTQTVYGVLFNSYSPSSGYEADSIKDFAIDILTGGGETQRVFQGQAAFQQGYQSYMFDPVETDHLAFQFLSTQGGDYFEAADLMICAVKSTPQVTPPAGKEIRQWASAATATSQYSDQDWSAAQATGAPDTATCGDNGTAWASSDANGIDELMVFFDTPVMATEINIYQTFNPGAISSVTALLAGTGDGIPIPNSTDPGTACPGVFTISIPEGLLLSPIDGLAIMVNQSDHPGWNEIDAVELVGYAAAGAPAGTNVPTGDARPLPESVACFSHAAETVNLRNGPGTDYLPAGQLLAGTTVLTIGYAYGSDGVLWQRITNGGWVRSDLVSTDPECHAPIPTITIEDPLPLTQRYVTPEGYSFDYPQEWVLIEEPGGATIGNSQAAAEKLFGDPYSPGEFQLSIRWMTVEELAPDTGLTAGASPMQLLKAAISVSSGIDLGEPYELAVGNDVVAAAYGTFIDIDVEIGVIIFDAGNGMYGSILTGSDLNGLEQFEPTVRAIVASTFPAAAASSEQEPTSTEATSTESTTTETTAAETTTTETTGASATADLPQTHTTADGRISFAYPEGWFVYEDLNIPYIYNSPEAQSQLSIGLSSGQVALQITKNMLPGLFGADPGEHITAYMQGLVDYLKLTPTPPTVTTIGGRPAAYALATSDGWSLWGVAIVVADDMMIEVLAYTAPGEFEQYQSIIMAIAESVVYTPPQ